MQAFSAGPSSGYALTFLSGGAFNPADATTYYIGNQPFAPVTNSLNRPVWIPRAGTIKIAYGTVLAAVAGTSENTTLSIRLNDTTDTTISSTLELSAAGLRTDFNNTALAIAVAAGDYVTLKWAMPTFTTNPTTVVISANIFVAI